MISFPSVVYRLYWSHDLHRHSLLLTPIGYQTAPDTTGRDPREVYTRGVLVQTPRVFDTILARLTREGRAEILTGPHCRVRWLSETGGRLEFMVGRPLHPNFGIFTWRRAKTTVLSSRLIPRSLWLHAEAQRIVAHLTAMGHEDVSHTVQFFVSPPQRR